MYVHAKSFYFFPFVRTVYYSKKYNEVFVANRITICKGIPVTSTHVFLCCEGKGNTVLVYHMSTTCDKVLPGGSPAAGEWPALMEKPGSLCVRPVALQLPACPYELEAI